METITTNNNGSVQPKRNAPRDVFLHLFVMVALYWSAISFITLCWQYVNYFFPDLLLNRYGNISEAGPIRFAVASLIIIFPLFILASWQLNRIYRREGTVRDSRVRKWLLYFTLFAASLIAIGDLITVIYNFLGGDITIHFILKALSVLVVMGVIFAYYLVDVRRAEPLKSAKYFALASGIAALILVVGAFFIVGSPMSARQMQFDQQRVTDLQNIQYQVVSYWQRKGQMPKTLADLNDSISGYAAPTDPQTSQPYQYTATDAAGLSFKLCATFDTSADQSQMSPAYAPAYPAGAADNWNHPAGTFCFDRHIDSALYPPVK